MREIVIRCIFRSRSSKITFSSRLLHSLLNLINPLNPIIQSSYIYILLFYYSLYYINTSPSYLHILKPPINTLPPSLIPPNIPPSYYPIYSPSNNQINTFNYPSCNTQSIPQFLSYYHNTIIIFVIILSRNNLNPLFIIYSIQ